MRAVLIACVLLIATQAARAEWTARSETDPITDAVTRNWSTDAVDPGDGKPLPRPLLGLVCEAGSPLQIAVAMGDHLVEPLGRDTADLIHRIDTAPPATTAWTVSRSGQSMRKVIDADLSAALLAGSRLIIRVNDRTGGQITAAFALSGIGGVVADATGDCPVVPTSSGLSFGAKPH
jgi:hypothetical protein